jgi:hypothetical protein
MTPDERHLAEAALSRVEIMATVMRDAARRSLTPTLLTELAGQADQVAAELRELTRKGAA